MNKQSSKEDRDERRLLA